MTSARRPRIARNLDTPRVIAYLRVSTDEQGDSGAGLAAQRKAVTEYCAVRGWADVEVVEEIESARDLDNRPLLLAAIDRLRSGQADILVTSKLDRVSRSVHDFSGLLDRTGREGWQLVMLDMAIDTSTPAGEFVANNLASAAQFERKLIGQRTRDALAARRAAGQRHSAPSALPRAVLDRVVALREAGTSIRGIAAVMNDEAVPTATGVVGGWRGSTVQAALSTAAYVAELAGRR